MKVNITQATDCIDFAAQLAHCAMAMQITGGTGRFKGASGMLTLNETVLPLLADASNKPVFFASTGDVTGKISGAAIEEERQADRR